MCAWKQRKRIQGGRHHRYFVNWEENFTSTWHGILTMRLNCACFSPLFPIGGKLLLRHRFKCMAEGFGGGYFDCGCLNRWSEKNFWRNIRGLVGLYEHMQGFIALNEVFVHSRRFPNSSPKFRSSLHVMIGEHFSQMFCWYCALWLYSCMPSPFYYKPSRFSSFLSSHFESFALLTWDLAITRHVYRTYTTLFLIPSSFI